jgi:predicted porin
MKKTLLALAVLGSFAGAASAQTNVQIYGVADAGISYTDNGAASNAKTWGLSSGGQSGSRIGFKGSEDLGGGLSAIFTLENGFNIDNGSLAQSDAATTRLFGRQAFVGLNGGFGAVKFGRQYSPLRSALESIDPFGLGLAGNISNVFNAYGERTDNTVNYSTPSIAGFSGQAAYSLGEVAGSTSTGRQFGLSAAYANGPLNVVLAHHNQNLAAGTPAIDNGDANTTMLGGTYNFGIAKLHAAYAVNKGDSALGATAVDSNDAMIGVSAPIGAGTLLASYIRRSDDIGANRDADQLAIGYTYDLSKRTNLYTSYAYTKNEAAVALNGAAAAGNDPKRFNVGIRHKF